MNARKDVSACKEHFKEGFKQLKMGMGCVIRVVKAVPAVVKEKQVARKEKGEVEKRRKAVEMKKKLDEEIKKSKEATEAGGDEEAATFVV